MTTANMSCNVDKCSQPKTKSKGDLDLAGDVWSIPTRCRTKADEDEEKHADELGGYGLPELDRPCLISHRNRTPASLACCENLWIENKS